MRARRSTSTLAGLALGVTAVAGFTGTAQAQTPAPYPPTTAAPEQEGAGAGASDPTPAPGQQVTVSSGADTFTPGSTVTVTLDGEVVGTVTASGSGAAVVEITAPDEPGTYQVVFTGTDDGAAATESVSITVQGAAAGGGTVTNPRPGVLGALPRTGADAVVPIAASGIALVVAGAGAIVVARRRSSELDSSARG